MFYIKDTIYKKVKLLDTELLKALKELLKDELKPLSDRLDRVEVKIDKNTLILEEVRGNIKSLAELHVAHREQNERAFDKTDIVIQEKSDLIETALTNTTKELNGIKDSIEVLTEAVGKHEMDIRILKKRPV
jgi:chromosome segregation ATPase